MIIGFGLALSSTAFGLQILTERGEMGTSHGRTAFSVLLLQDLAVVPLLTLVSLLAAETTLLEGLEFALLDAVLVIAVRHPRWPVFPLPDTAAGSDQPDGGGVHRRGRVRGAGHGVADGGSRACRWRWVHFLPG